MYDYQIYNVFMLCSLQIETHINGRLVVTVDVIVLQKASTNVHSLKKKCDTLNFKNSFLIEIDFIYIESLSFHL